MYNHHMLIQSLIFCTVPILVGAGLGILANIGKRKHPDKAWLIIIGFWVLACGLGLLWGHNAGTWLK